jgi:tetratricopeptide (TPR) repeat protein
VTWVAGREELLMTLGALGCLHCHLSARRLEETGGRRGKALACYAGAALCCGIACLSNAVGAVIPLLIAAWDVLTLARPKLWKIVGSTSALWVIALVTIVLKRVGDTSDTSTLPRVLSGPWLMSILNVYWLNLKALVWPTGLAIHYLHPDPRSFLDQEVVLGGMAIGLTCVVLWVTRRRKPALFGLVWFGLALGPTSQIMPHHIARADRFLYLPLVGLVVAVAMLLRPLGSALRGPLAVAGVAAVGALGLLLLELRSAGQIRTWRDSRAAWENAVEQDPNDALAHSSLADNLAEAGRFDQAILHYERAIRIDPRHAESLSDFAWFLATCENERLRDYDRALCLIERACECRERNDPRILRRLAIVHCSSADHLAAPGRGEFARAIEHYRAALQADPEYDVALFNLALLLTTCSDEKLRRPEEAVELAERGCRLIEAPDAHRLLILAAAYAEAGRFAEAAATAEKAIPLAQAAGDWEMADDLQRRWDYYRSRIAPGTSGP